MISRSGDGVGSERRTSPYWRCTRLRDCPHPLSFRLYPLALMEFGPRRQSARRSAIPEPSTFRHFENSRNVEVCPGKENDCRTWFSDAWKSRWPSFPNSPFDVSGILKRAVLRIESARRFVLGARSRLFGSSVIPPPFPFSAPSTNTNTLLPEHDHGI